MKTAPSMNVIEECWNVYADAALPDGTPPNVSAFVRRSFYAGVAFMYDLLMQNSENEDEGMAMLEALDNELDEYSAQMAAAAGLDLDKVREAIAAKLSKR